MRGYLPTGAFGGDDIIPFTVGPRPRSDHEARQFAARRARCPSCGLPPPDSWKRAGITWVSCPRCGAPWDVRREVPDSQSSHDARAIARLNRRCR